jgi:hypothetical protein
MKYVLFLAYFSYFEKNRSRCKLSRSCLCVCDPPISLCISIYISLSLLSNGSVKKLPRQRIHTQQQRNSWMRRFYAMRVISEENI